MACGCIPLMPSFGAANEFCSALSPLMCHNSKKTMSFYDATVSLMKNDVLRLQLLHSAIEFAARFTVEEAAVSMATALLHALKKT